MSGNGGRRSSSRGPEDKNEDLDEDEEEDMGEDADEGDDDLRRREEEDLSGYQGGDGDDEPADDEQAEDEEAQCQDAGDGDAPGPQWRPTPSGGGGATKGAGARRSHPVVVCMVGEPNVSEMLMGGV